MVRRNIHFSRTCEYNRHFKIRQTFTGVTCQQQQQHDSVYILMFSASCFSLKCNLNLFLASEIFMGFQSFNDSYTACCQANVEKQNTTIASAMESLVKTDLVTSFRRRIYLAPSIYIGRDWLRWSLNDDDANLFFFCDLIIEMNLWWEFKWDKGDYHNVSPYTCPSTVDSWEINLVLRSV